MAVRKGSGAFKILSLLIENGPMRRADLMQNIMPEKYHTRKFHAYGDPNKGLLSERKTVWKANWGHSFFVQNGACPVDRASLVLRGYIVLAGKDRGSLVFAITGLGIAAWAAASKKK
jgi:hypothetical protein